MNNWYIFPGQKVTPSILILFGTLLIGMGGLVATYGWNKRSELNRRQGMIHAIAAECVFNGNVIERLQFEVVEQNFKILLHTRTVALDAAISSGMFNSEADKKFFTFMIRVSDHLSYLNRGIDRLEDVTINQTENKSLYDGFAKSKFVRDTLLDVVAFRKFLIDEFGVQESDHPFVMDISKEIEKIIRDAKSDRLQNEEETKSEVKSE